MQCVHIVSLSSKTALTSTMKVALVVVLSCESIQWTHQADLYVATIFPTKQRSKRASKGTHEVTWWVETPHLYPASPWGGGKVGQWRELRQRVGALHNALRPAHHQPECLPVRAFPVKAQAARSLLSAAAPGPVLLLSSWAVDMMLCSLKLLVLVGMGSKISAALPCCNSRLRAARCRLRAGPE
jgi:hypothetical protein